MAVAPVNEQLAEVVWPVMASLPHVAAVSSSMHSRAFRAGHCSMSRGCSSVRGGWFRLALRPLSRRDAHQLVPLIWRSHYSHGRPHRAVMEVAGTSM